MSKTNNADSAPERCLYIFDFWLMHPVRETDAQSSKSDVQRNVFLVRETDAQSLKSDVRQNTDTVPTGCTAFLVYTPFTKVVLEYLRAKHHQHTRRPMSLQPKSLLLQGMSLVDLVASVRAILDLIDAEYRVEMDDTCFSDEDEQQE